MMLPVKTNETADIYIITVMALWRHANKKKTRI